MKKIIPVEVSARHIHLSREDADVLFGENYELKKLKDLSQPSDFAAEETVNFISGDKKIANVRIIGPLRQETQAELCITDAKNLKLNPEIRLSGDLINTNGGLVVEGPNGKIVLEKGVIIAKRHIHCGTDEAKEYDLSNNDVVSVRISGERGLVFDNVVVRVANHYRISMQIDTDEGNAAGINRVGEGLII